MGCRKLQITEARYVSFLQKYKYIPCPFRKSFFHCSCTYFFKEFSENWAKKTLRIAISILIGKAKTNRSEKMVDQKENAELLQDARDLLFAGFLEVEDLAKELFESSNIAKKLYLNQIKKKVPKYLNLNYEQLKSEEQVEWILFATFISNRFVLIDHTRVVK